MTRRSWLVYAGTLVLAGTVIALVHRAGAGLVAGSRAVTHAGAAATHAAPTPHALDGSTVLHILLALIAIIVAARALGALFRKIGQPPVVGEVVAGICLGPSLLGRVSPAAQEFVLPASTAPYLGAIAQVGVALFMFLVGLELDTGLLRRRTQATVAISHASIVVPFVLGTVASLWLYPAYGTTHVSFTVFALFAGVSVSVTAFPVLARILTDRAMHRSEIGVVALACAAVDDVTAWCLLALVVGVTHARLEGAAWTALLSIAYVALMLGLMRPLVARMVRGQELRGKVSPTAIAVVVIALLASTLTTEWIGLHAIFGAFLLGAIIPHDSRLARSLVSKLEDVVVVLFLPAFFAFTGMRTQLGLLDTPQAWLACAGIVALASAGKFGGSFVAGRLVGMPPREAAAIGILMNTRGLMELVVLNIGLDLDVISPTLFVMMVVMALVTTFATTPILSRLVRGDAEVAGAPAARDL